MTPPPDTHDLASELVVLSARLVRAVRREADYPASVRVLSILDETGPLGISALAAIDRCSQPTMSGTVSRLVADGLVTKSPSPRDARSQVVALAADGRRALGRVRDTAARMVADRVVGHGHTAEELATAVLVLRSVLSPTPDQEPS